MRRLAAIVGVTLALVSSQGLAQRTQGVKSLWVDFDFNDIPEPKERSGVAYSSMFRSEFTARWKAGADITNAFKTRPKPAANVNVFDEVPDSSWFTNRHGLRPMSANDIVRGPNRGRPPDFSHGVITSVKTEGVTPGLIVKDNTGQRYVIKFDQKDYPELQSGAEVISTKILHAAGYNVPENYAVRLNPANFEIGPNAEVGRGKDRHRLLPSELKQMLEGAALQPNGTYRALASKFLSGVPKGPFSFFGVRSDDPNDLIPHQDRRELRGLRVISSWLNNWDVKEPNTLDMYVEEGGKRFLRHYLIDFGSSLGGGAYPKEYFHGREYAFDKGSIVKEIFTLGLHLSADEKEAPITYPAVGLFMAEDFDPGSWKTSFHVEPFEQMTRTDALWATRIMLSFSDEELRRIVHSAEYTDPAAAEQVLKVLRERREIIARHWLKGMNPAARFAVENGPAGAILRFDDLLSAHSLSAPSPYSYEIIAAGTTRARAPKKGSHVTHATRINLGRPVEGVCVFVWSKRDEKAGPVRVCVNPEKAGVYRIASIDRL